jgi:uncharacterized protein
VGLTLTRAADLAEFERAAGDFLRAREAEHNLILGICSNLRAAGSAFAMGQGTNAAPPYFAVIRDGERVVGAALRTPPLNTILSAMDDPRGADLVVADQLETRDLPGVLGERGLAKRFADLWTARTGRRARVKTAERIFQLTRVITPRPTPGRMRHATMADLDLVAAWFRAFIREALREEGDDARVTAEYWLTRPGRLLYLWEDDGRPVSMTGASGRTPNGIRIGAVYTPPELRGRGYASNLVAQVSQAQLDGGLRYCFLYTDLANPTSNHIYQEIGYTPVADVDEYRFED